MNRPPRRPPVPQRPPQKPRRPEWLASQHQPQKNICVIEPERLIEILRVQKGWIPATNEKPPHDLTCQSSIFVAVYCQDTGKIFYNCRYDFSHKQWYSENGHPISNATHWRYQFERP